MTVNCGTEWAEKEKKHQDEYNKFLQESKQKKIEDSYETQISDLKYRLKQRTLFGGLLLSLTISALIRTNGPYIDTGLYRGIRNNTEITYEEIGEKDKTNTMYIIDSLGVKYELIDNINARSVKDIDYKDQNLEKICVSKLNVEPTCYNIGDTAKDATAKQLFTRYTQLYNDERSHMRKQLAEKYSTE